MNIVSKKWGIALSCLLAFASMASTLYAVEVVAPSLSLKKTWIKTEDSYLLLTSVPVDAFTPTQVTCPGRGKCTVRIEVSSEFGFLKEPHVIQMKVLVDGVVANPGEWIYAQSTPLLEHAVRTFSWIQTNLTPGTHLVDVEFRVSGETAEAARRTLTIGVYKP